MEGLIRDWPSLARCRDGDPDALFVQGAEQHVAKRVCQGCPVRYECLADALDNRIEFGVWGGMTERERRALLRRHPQVASWKRTFEAASSRAEVARPRPSEEVASPVGSLAISAAGASLEQIADTPVPLQAQEITPETAL